MSRNYDNWERIVAAVLKREQIWKICREHSRTPSLLSSLSSSSGFRSSSSFSSPSFNLLDPKDEFFKSAKSLSFQYLSEFKISVKPETSELEEAGQLVHFHGSPFAFGLEELLMAPSSVLGDELETFRNTYIIRLKEAITFVAKRFERGDFSQAALERRVKAIGSIEHENVVKLRGCYLSQDENLGFFDYFPQGSVYTMLHGKTGENRVRLDWKARIGISIGAAKGLAHIHRQSGGNFIHGNIKSSNIFLNPQQYGCVADIYPAIARFSEYFSPEVSESEEKKFSQASDVYSFGVVLIELISGRSPLRYYLDGKRKTFVDWAIHNARDEWTAMVFDRGLLKDPLGMQGMCDMLMMALFCVEKKPEERPNMEYVVKMLDSILVSRNFQY